MASLYRIASTVHCLRYKSTTTTAAVATTNLVAFRKYYAAKKSINLPFAGRIAASASLGSYSSSEKIQYTTATTSAISGDGTLPCSTSLREAYGFNLKSPQQQLMQKRKFSSLQSAHMQPITTNSLQQSTMTPARNNHSISAKEITRNMTLYTTSPLKCDVDKNTLEFKNPTGNPLVLLMAWLMARQKHLKKYAQIYTEMGFDVLVVHITPWQLLWPTKGTQIIASDTLKFLENNKSYAPIVVHGFSVGAYQFGELMLQMSRDMQRYSQILDRMTCQVWDSAADITEIPVGVPKSIFPRNPRMESALRNYTLYHMKTFHNQATIHYMRSSQMFHSTLLKAPALFFVSDNDLIGPPSSNNAVRENWERANVKVTFKCWEKSLHAGHILKHRDEYLEMLFKHLESCGVLEQIGYKSRAKL